VPCHQHRGAPAPDGAAAPGAKRSARESIAEDSLREEPNRPLHDRRVFEDAVVPEAARFEENGIGPGPGERPTVADGNPNVPALMAGEQIVLAPRSSATSNALRYADARRSSLSCPPKPHTGPTAWMTHRAGSAYAPVATAVPVGVPAG